MQLAPFDLLSPILKDHQHHVWDQFALLKLFVSYRSLKYLSFK